MATTQMIEVNFSQPDCMSRVYPRLPILTSQPSVEREIYIAYHHQPPHETPEYFPAQYIIGIHLGQPEIVEQWWADEYYSKENLVYGDISVYPANCPQRQRWNQTCEFIEIYLLPELFVRTAQELTESDSVEILLHLTFRDPLIQQIGLTLKADLETTATTDRCSSSAFNNRLYIDSIANLLVVHLLKHYFIPKQKIQNCKGKLPQHKLKRVLAYIHENLEQDLGLNELASIAEMGAHYFASQFKQSTGQPPHQYVTTYRIQEAKTLLANKQLSISEICGLVGFQCQSHFTKVFRKHTGMTPVNYRNVL